MIILFQLPERESTIVKNLFDQSLVKLYIRYIKDTLILIKEKDIDLVQKWYEKVDLLDIGTAGNKKSLYHEPRKIDHYIKFHVQISWTLIAPIDQIIISPSKTNLQHS